MRDIKLILLAEEDGSREQLVENATKCPKVGAEGGNTSIQDFRREPQKVYPRLRFLSDSLADGFTSSRKRIVPKSVSAMCPDS